VCHARLAIDIGGTFTDVVLELADGSRVTTKLLTTGAYPGDAVLAGITDVSQPMLLFSGAVRQRHC